MPDWEKRRDAMRSHTSDARDGLLFGGLAGVVLAVASGYTENPLIPMLGAGAVSAGGIYALGRIGLCTAGYGYFQLASLGFLSAAILNGYDAPEDLELLMRAVPAVALSNTAVYLTARRTFHKNLDAGGGYAFGRRPRLIEAILRLFGTR